MCRPGWLPSRVRAAMRTLTSETGRPSFAQPLSVRLWMMPQLSGMELFSRAVAARPGVEKRFIFMTGGVFTTATQQFLASTPAPHVLKPFDPAQVETLIALVANQSPPPPP